MDANAQNGDVQIAVRDLTMAYGDDVVMRDLSFEVHRGDVFVIMGASGCGKSTLLKHMVGLLEPAHGQVLYEGQSFTDADPDQRAQLLRTFGVLYQKGALWSTLTLSENIELLLEEYTPLPRSERRDLASFKLALVGLSGFENHYPREISGGMQKRAGLARALALDPRTLFLDEPSAGLDPLSSRRLDDLILELKHGLGATIVVVTHELESIFTIADDSVFLDVQSKTISARGAPRELVDSASDANVRAFLRRGEEERGEQAS
jgi:phospholipid/cholesterol/gamma-HCH transport system ATP-binding protein